MMYVSASNSTSQQRQPTHHHDIAAAASTDNDTSASSTDDDQRAFELSQYTPLGVDHFSAPYKNDPKALEKLSRRINHRVEQDSSGLITFCDKRIRKRQKKQAQSKSKQQQGEERSHHDGTVFGGSSAVGPEIVSATDLMLGKCLGQGSFSSVFVLEKHLHRPPSVNAGPRRGRRSKLATGTNQGSISRRGTSMRFGGNSSHNRSNHSRSNHSTSRHSTATTASTKSRTGRSPTCLRRRVRQEYKTTDDIRDGSRRSLLDNSSSQRSRSLSPSISSKGRSSSNGRKNDDSSRRTRSLSRSLRDGIRACFGKKPRDHRDSSQTFENEEDEAIFYRQKIKRSKSNESIFRGGSRSLSCRKRRSQTRRSRSQDEMTRHRSADEMARTSRTSFNTNDPDDTNSGHSFDISPPTSSRGVLWKKNYPREEIDESCGGANSNLVVKILQPKLMANPKLFANCGTCLRCTIHQN